MRYQMNTFSQPHWLNLSHFHLVFFNMISDEYFWIHIIWNLNISRIVKDGCTHRTTSECCEHQLISAQNRPHYCVAISICILRGLFSCYKCYFHVIFMVADSDKRQVQEPLTQNSGEQGGRSLVRGALFGTSQICDPHSPSRSFEVWGQLVQGSDLCGVFSCQEENRVLQLPGVYEAANKRLICYITFSGKFRD